METVIQKYLRNEYATIDEYNAQAGELAEPYPLPGDRRFPDGFEAESLRRLTSIATTGPRCGVYTHHPPRHCAEPMPPGGAHGEILAHSVRLLSQERARSSGMTKCSSGFRCAWTRRRMRKS